MQQTRTRTFQATYTSSDGKKHPLNVRIFKRLRYFGLLLVLVKNASNFEVVTDKKENEQDSKNGLNNKNKDENIALIDEIIKNNPNILNNIELGLYTVVMGDTIESIADACGTSVQRICELNGIKNGQTFYAGQVLRVETTKAKDDLDREIAALESYFYDYLFQSEVAKIAKSNDPNLSKQSSLFRSILFGNPKSEEELDASSIFGKYVSYYVDFHGNNQSEKSVKRDYINKLLDLEKKANNKLNLNGKVDLIIPFAIYNVFIKNGTTDFDIDNNFGNL